MEITEEVNMLRLVLVVACKIVALVGWVQIPYLNPNTLMVELVDIPALEADA